MELDEDEINLSHCVEWEKLLSPTANEQVCSSSLFNLLTTYTSRGYYSLVYNLSRSMLETYKVIYLKYLDRYGLRSAVHSKDAIECFTYNMVRAVKLGYSEISFSSDRNRYTKVVINGRAIATGVGYDATINLVNLFEEEGLLFRETGYRVEGVTSKSGYLVITQRLVEMIEVNTDLDKVKIGARTEVLILRDSSEVSLEFPSTNYTKEIIRVLTKYNKMMEKCEVMLGATKLETGLARIFNIDFQHGGRLYTSGTSYQGVAAHLRKYITINGMQTAEVDIKGSHISILHTMVGSRLLDGYDPYEIPMEGIAEYDVEKVSLMLCQYDERYNPFRNLVKLALLIMINASSEHKAAYSLKEKINEQIRRSIADVDKMTVDQISMLTVYGLKNVDVTKLFSALKHKHEVIKEYFFSGAGVWLQKMEGDIFTKVIEMCIHKDYPVLVIHDSCRADVRQIKEIGDFITAAWYEVVGDVSNLKLEYEF